MMFRLGAIMTVAAAAAPWASAEASEEGNYSESRQLGGRWRRKVLTATVLAGADQGGAAFEATVKAEKKRGKVVWTVKIHNAGLINIQCEAYNWHIHAKKIQGTQDCGSTGGHSDNSLMCGGATDRGDDCRALYNCPSEVPLSKCYKEEYAQRCNMGIWAFRGKLSQARASLQGCEYGDLSGKMGKIEVTTATQQFEDYHLEDLSTYAQMSLVLHCCNSGGCSQRVACGDFELK